jgi:hypothetical protein
VAELSIKVDRRAALPTANARARRARKGLETRLQKMVGGIVSGHMSTQRAVRITSAIPQSPPKTCYERHLVRRGPPLLAAVTAILGGRESFADGVPQVACASSVRTPPPPSRCS